METESTRRRRARGPRPTRALAACVALCAPRLAWQEGQPAQATTASLEATRMVMGKWIETQQIISKEQGEWQQGREILVGRAELAKHEIADVEGKLAEVQAKLVEIDAKRAELAARSERLAASNARLAEVVTRLEAQVRRLFATLPEPIQTKLRPLYERIPVDPASTKASVAERYQNVLVILTDLNRANHELSVTYEVRTLSSGKPAEVRVLYVGLAQAYYLSAGGESGIGRPGANGWDWQPNDAIAAEVSKALEMHQGKHTPAFVPLPVKIQ